MGPGRPALVPTDAGGIFKSLDSDRASEVSESVHTVSIFAVAKKNVTDWRRFG